MPMLKQTLLTTFFILFYMMTSTASPILTYHLSMPEPHTHYFEVETKISGLDQETVDLKMAVWTPGSYLVREFARKVEGFEAQTGDSELDFKKINKNTWRIETAGSSEISVKYRVYSFEFSVRTSFLDASHAYINGASVFMFIDGHLDLPSTLHIQPHNNFNTISTALKPVDGDQWVLSVPNYDLLADSPIEIGTHKVVDFEAAKTPHHLALVGEGNYDEELLVSSIQKVVEECTNIFGDLPTDDYTFINFSTDGKYGGLEHLHSTCLMYPRWNYSPRPKLNRWLGLMAHEYFHLWNIKRIRPQVLGPFDYENENYTTLLWVAEGVTSYYDDHLLVRTGLMTEEEYLKVVAGNINSHENRPGKKVQSVTEASFDAWIKYYRSDENFNNCCISYYTKGAVLSTLLDLEILHNTKGKKSMDDVMRYMYDEYYKNQQRGFTDEEFQAAVEKFAGKELDPFFTSHVSGVEPIDYQKYFDYVGLTLENTADADKIALGVNLNSSNKVTAVKRGSCGYESGLNVNDEIIAIDNYRVKSSDNIATLLARKSQGDQVDIMVSRGGEIMHIQTELHPAEHFSYKLSMVEKPSRTQKKLYKAWLKIRNEAKK